jgi:2-keto-4-pentenoate hydratase/2-oxohepta-3-ene-1,7-dioic acid hydratase in catechol pathway
MKFVNYVDNDGDHLGVLSGDGARIIPLAELGYEFRDMLDLIARYETEVKSSLPGKLAQAPIGLVLADAVLDAPIPHPRHDLLSVGLNYREHAMESARYKGIEYKPPPHPVYFSKRVNRAVAPGGCIPSHSDVTGKLDYETELAVVIGSRCDHVAKEDVFKHVFGYTIVNDVSARDVQVAHVQYTFGKGMDGFAPMGPWIATRDEFKDPPHLAVMTRVNGELRQNSNTSEFIFDIPYLVSELSSAIVLESGDIIITGTPSGVGIGFQPPRFLKSGDRIECEIEGIGVLANTVE